MRNRPLPARLRKSRKAKGLSQGALARQVGVTQSYISQLERGDIGEPGSYRVASLEQALGLEHGYLTSGGKNAAHR